MDRMPWARTSCRSASRPASMSSIRDFPRQWRFVGKLMMKRGLSPTRLAVHDGSRHEGCRRVKEITINERTPHHGVCRVPRLPPVTPRAVPRPASFAEAAVGINRSDRSRAMAPGELRLRMLLARGLSPASSESDKLIHQFLARRLAQPDSDLEQLAEPLCDRRNEIERRLLQCFGRLSGEQQSAAIELLGCVGSESLGATVDATASQTVNARTGSSRTDQAGRRQNTQPTPAERE